MATKHDQPEDSGEHVEAAGFNPNLHEPFLRRAADTPDEEDSGAALGAFLTLRLVDVWGRRHETPPEHTGFQIQATRDFLSDRPDDPETPHQLAIVTGFATAFQARLATALWPPLRDYTRWLSDAGRLEEAQDVIETALATSAMEGPEQWADAQLTYGRALRDGGRLDEAQDAYAAAERHASDGGAPHLQLLSRIGYGNVLRQRGYWNKARAVLERVARDAAAQGDADAEARARHDLSVTLSHSGTPEAAVRECLRALQLYPDASDRERALLDLGRVLAEGSWYVRAAGVLALTAASENALVRSAALTALLGVVTASGDRVGYQRWRKAAERGLDLLQPDRAAELAAALDEADARFGAAGPAEPFAEPALDADLEQELEGLMRAAS